VVISKPAKIKIALTRRNNPVEKIRIMRVSSPAKFDLGDGFLGLILGLLWLFKRGLFARRRKTIMKTTKHRKSVKAKVCATPATMGAGGFHWIIFGVSYNSVLGSVS
jgi:hypothetical protein